MMIPIAGPFASEAAVIIHLAYMSALAPHAELLRGAHREGDRLVTARAVTIELDPPHLVVTYDIVPGVRHVPLLESLRRPR
jgi:hypothetical protein